MEQSNVVKDLKLQTNNLTNWMISISARRGWKCRRGCSCICHVRRKYKSPAFFSRFLGRIFVGYSGLPILGHCSEEACQMQSLSSIDIVYFFPLWFLHRAISLVAEWPSISTPSFGLTVHRVLPANSPECYMISLIHDMDTQGIRSAIEKRYIYPNDRFGSNEFTALHVSKPKEILLHQVN